MSSVGSVEDITDCKVVLHIGKRGFVKTRIDFGYSRHHWSTYGLLLRRKKGYHTTWIHRRHRQKIWVVRV